MSLNIITNRTHAPQTFCKRDLVSLYLHWHWWLYRIILCCIVSLIIVSYLMMAKSETAETCSWCIMYNCKYSCVVTAMPIHSCSFTVRCFTLSHSPVRDIDTCFLTSTVFFFCLCSATHYCNYKDRNKCHSPGHCPLCSAMFAVIIFGVLQSCDCWCVHYMPSRCCLVMKASLPPSAVHRRLPNSH